MIESKSIRDQWKIKRFLLFAGEAFYPLAGWNSFIDSFENLEDAISSVAEYPEGEYIFYRISEDTHDWFEIVDLATRKPVKQGGRAFGGLFGGKEWQQRQEYND